MKKMYHVGDDLFIAAAFVCFITGGFFYLLNFQNLAFGVTPRHLIQLAAICLLFSISLSLYDMAHE